MRAGLVSTFSAALLAAACGGCGGGGDDRPYVAPTVPARGKVTFNGKPLGQGTITLEPDAGREAHGNIGPGGSFVLSTFGNGDGAVPGVHRVAVEGTVEGTRQQVPAKFRSLGSSKVEVEVSAGKTDYTIDLK